MAQLPLAQAVLDALPNPLLILDGESNVVMVNSAAEDFFQSGSQVLLKASLDDLMPATSPVCLLYTSDAADE